MHNVWTTRGNEEDITSHIEDSIRSGELTIMTTKTKPAKPVISIQVINITCACGAYCENEAGSTMFDISDDKATCPDCGEVYMVPTGVFEKKLRSK